MQTRVTTIAFSASCASIAALVALAGCSGSGMDRRIADLTREQSLRLRQELDGPTVPVVASGRAPGEAREKSPTSVNPRADELNFTAAAEDRDVAARLRRLLGQVNVDRQLLGDPERMAAEMMASTEGVEVQTITLEQAWQISQRTGREYLTAQEDYLLSAISLLQERHQAFEGHPFNELHREPELSVVLAAARDLAEVLVAEQHGDAAFVEKAWPVVAHAGEPGLQRLHEAQGTGLSRVGLRGDEHRAHAAMRQGRQQHPRTKDACLVGDVDHRHASLA